MSVRRTDFTLVELLVVIGIIALLVAWPRSDLTACGLVAMNARETHYWRTGRTLSARVRATPHEGLQTADEAPDESEDDGLAKRIPGATLPTTPASKAGGRRRGKRRRRQHRAQEARPWTAKPRPLQRKHLPRSILESLTAEAREISRQQWCLMGRLLLMVAGTLLTIVGGLYTKQWPIVAAIFAIALIAARLLDMGLVTLVKRSCARCAADAESGRDGLFEPAARRYRPSRATRAAKRYFRAVDHRIPRKMRTLVACTHVLIFRQDAAAFAGALLVAIVLGAVALVLVALTAAWWMSPATALSTTHALILAKFLIPGTTGLIIPLQTLRLSFTTAAAKATELHAKAIDLLDELRGSKVASSLQQQVNELRREVRELEKISPVVPRVIYRLNYWGNDMKCLKLSFRCRSPKRRMVRNRVIEARPPSDDAGQRDAGTDEGREAGPGPS